MTKRIHFFATFDDIAEVLDIVEDEVDLKYVPLDYSDTDEFEEFTSYRQIAEIGIAISKDQSHNPGYLIVRQDERIVSEMFHLRKGGVRYCVDQVKNSTSIVLKPGGVYNQSCVIAGEMSTCRDDNQDSLDLANQFARVIRKKFTRIRSYYVGKDAEALYEIGYRLTSDARMPKEYDLSKG